MITEPLRILIGSPVRQKPNILKAFLDSLVKMDLSGFAADYFFIDNNDNQDSSDLLAQFCVQGQPKFIKKIIPFEEYNCTEDFHCWKTSLITQVAFYKNTILNFALANQYNYLFLVDSDLYPHPFTLQQLISAGKDIISEIYWTRWTADSCDSPQVWLSGEYSFHIGGNKISVKEQQKQTVNMVNRLKTPGIYEVGGLGGCTLISRKVLSAGVNFDFISNLDYWGEDRHFCIRAAVLGFKMYVDTHYPALHLYRESDLEKLPDFKKNTPTVERSKANDR